MRQTIRLQLNEIVHAARMTMSGDDVDNNPKEIV